MSEAPDVPSSGGVASSLGLRWRRDHRHRHHHHHRHQYDEELREFAQTTSLHGVPRVISARSLVARVFWSTVCLGAFLMFLVNSASLLHQYRSYPKKVNVEVVQRPVIFPSVTICNKNHLDTLVVNKLDSLFDYAVGTTMKTSGDVQDFMRKYSAFSDKLTAFLKHSDNLSVMQYNYEIPEMSSRVGLVANVGPKLASAAGIRIEDFIIDCRFMNDVCNLSLLFVKTFDSYYYNCFTFQPQMILESGATRLSGVEYGLSLLLFLGSAGRNKVKSNGSGSATGDDDGGEQRLLVPGMQDTHPALVSGPGARVVVHSPDTMPHPTAEGYDVPAEFSVTIGVSARENMRVSQPHGNCTRDKRPPTETTEDASLRSKYRYTLVDCQNACIRRQIVATCRCIDNRVETPEQLDQFDKNTRETLPYCVQLPPLPRRCLVLHEDDSDLRGHDYQEVLDRPSTVDVHQQCAMLVSKFRERLNCRREVYENMTLRRPEDIDACRCYPPCSDVTYDTSYSLSTLPPITGEHETFYSHFDRFLQSTLSPERRRLLGVQDIDKKTKSGLRHLLTRVVVHIADSNVIKTTESPDYDLIRLVSDIGGQLGLWIGVSVITLVEVVQLAALIIRVLTAHRRRRLRPNVKTRSSNEQTDRLRPECDGIEAASVSMPVCGSLLPPVTTSASLLINIGPSCIVSPRPSDLSCDQRPSHNALSHHRLPAYDWRTVRRLPYDQLQRLKQSVGASDKTTTV